MGTALFCRGLLNAKMKLGTTLGQVVCRGHLSGAVRVCSTWIADGWQDVLETRWSMNNHCKCSTGILLKFPIYVGPAI